MGVECHFPVRRIVGGGLLPEINSRFGSQARRKKTAIRGKTDIWIVTGADVVQQVFNPWNVAERIV